ncbi:restriction endonuclease subunit S [Endozoicomonas sp. 8E]|uniref:restriction endonuclease subunit S n=1 Tax=Endozoicomonas sp. 8E TaxID=3035692 RepID=UPI002938D5B8|nr:restriction endonuclease subunit S [Endozoicomonas sp. 8E]WOG27148.1 restriction endonuclease subunit S [Endozoicomonas sp. 8E]
MDGNSLERKKYAAYLEYKDSGVEWLGDVPAHWTVGRYKFCAQRIVVGIAEAATHAYADEGTPIIRSTNIREEGLDTNGLLYIKEEFAEQNESKYLYANDIITVRTGFPGISSVIPVELDRSQCFTNLVATPKQKFVPEFLAYFLNSHTGKSYFELLGWGSAQKNISVPILQNFPIAYPSYVEQKAILSFLGHETAKIDTLIEEQQSLIRLLKEKRQAVISHAVTKGLNPDAPMKDSGVEWLGEVPEHWTVTRAKFLFDFVTSGSRGWAEYYSEDGSLFFRIANLTRDTIEPKLESIQNVNPPAGSEGERSQIKNDDLLISITADLGSVCVADSSVSDGYVSQHVALCRPGQKVINSRWLAYFVLSDCAKEQLLGSGYGGTKIQLSLEDIRELWVLQPPEDEQIDLAQFVDKQMDRYSELSREAENQIQFLQERRTALISAAVTGKIDVRDWQPATEQKEHPTEATV